MRKLALPIVLMFAALLLSAACGGGEPAPSGPAATGKIAFISGRDGSWGIYVMNADGSNVTRTTTLPQGSRDPS